MKKAPGCDHCAIHGAKQQMAKQGQKALQNFRITMWKADAVEGLNSPDLKSLREEIVLVRIMVTQKWEACKDDQGNPSAAKLMLASGAITGMLVQLGKLVESCHKIEAATGFLVDKTDLMRVMGTILQILGEEVKDPEVFGQISKRLMDTISKENGGTDYVVS